MEAFCLCCLAATIGLSVSAFSEDWDSIFSYQSYLDEDHLFKLYWSNLEDDDIEFGLEAEATGWIALGISPNGQMPNSDVMIGWVDGDDGNVYLQDRHSIARSAPLYDEDQGLTLVSGEEVDGFTRIRFKRDKFVCNEQDLSIEQGTTRLIWAFHSTDDPSAECFASEDIEFHTNKGSQSMNLDTGIAEEVELEADAQHFDLLLEDVQVPATDTTYYCKLFELPVLNETHHIIKMEPIVEAGNEALVHHLVAYICPKYLVRNESHIGYERVCGEWEQNMPSRECLLGELAYAWAVGGNALYFPRIAGLPMSGDSKVHYLVLEIHYDNPREESGRMDSSGIRIHHTRTLRQYHAGILTVGAFAHPAGQIIPPGIESAVNYAGCTSQCTEAGINETLYIFGAALHAHQIGRALNLRHFRNGQELAPIDSNWAYDFNYQQTVLLDDMVELEKGDELFLECYVDSSSRTDFTIGGLASTDEMCTSLLFVYPAPKLSYCVSGHDPQTLSNWIQEAQNEGYIEGNIDNVFDDTTFWFNLTGLQWDHEKPGHEEMYRRLWEDEEFNSRWYFCGAGNSSVIDPYVDEQIDPADYQEFDVGVHECTKDIATSDSAAGQCSDETDMSVMHSFCGSCGYIFAVMLLFFIF